MIDYQDVSIQAINFNATGAEEVYENLRILYTTPEGSVPFDRSFGINTDFLDEPDVLARGKLIVEYTEKTKIFEPRVRVDQVTFDPTETGQLKPKVVIRFE